MASDFSIRSLIRADELSAVMDLQYLICGEESNHTLSLHTLVDFARNGGQVIGAFEGQYLVGLLVAFLGTDSRDPHRPAMANLKLVLDRIAVHPDYRGIGLATRMALRLRDLCVQQGIRLATYIFDPLNSREAYLMIRKLGAIGKNFVPDFYGIHEPSDRLVAEWWVTHNRVEERLFGSRGRLSLTQYFEAETPILNPSLPLSDTQYVIPHAEDLSIPDKSMVFVEIPSEYTAMVHAHPELTQRWQGHIRDTFLYVMQQGYIVTDFLYETYEGRTRAFYLMSYDGPRLTITL